MHMEDWRILREHRIIGSFHGSSSSAPHQSNSTGFPMVLTKNETTLLLDKGLARLRKSDDLVNMPGNDIKNSMTQVREESMANQVSLLMEEKRQQILEKADIIVNGKLAKRRRLGYLVDESKIKSELLEEEIGRITKPEKGHLYVEICTEDPLPLNWIDVKWNYPKSEQEKVEYAAFRRLWEDGYCVTPGGKFGGDLLAYSGDCFLTHALFLVTCVSRNDPLNVNSVVAKARLAHTVRKTAVLAYLDSDGEVIFQSLSWADER